MHSKAKLLEKYPDMTIDMLKRFYGKPGSIMESEEKRELWNNMAFVNSVAPKNSSNSELHGIHSWLDNLDLREFFDTTYSVYTIFYCRFGSIDCRGYWRKA